MAILRRGTLEELLFCIFVGLVGRLCTEHIFLTMICE